MKPSVLDLQQELKNLTVFLDENDPLSLTASEARALRAECREIEKKLDSLESGFLTIGLLGGTGVGKSTIMNALAGSDIASTSHRRPHTGTVLVYRHEHIQRSPDLSPERIPWMEITHKADEIKHIILCDLPDFDSILDEHRQYVIEFLENLDLLVWASSPEKYADGRFYDLLTDVPKAKDNDTFVLNKADVFFRTAGGETGYEQLALASGKFRSLLEENGFRDPLLYIVSAEEARQREPVSPWNQFPAFRQYIFRQRKAKQVLAIKTANLDVEVTRLMDSFHREIRLLDRLEKALAGVQLEIRESRQEWADTGSKAMDSWLNARMLRRVLSDRILAEKLVGPGRYLALLLHMFRRDSVNRDESGQDLTPLQPPESSSLPFRRRLEWVRDKTESSLMLSATSPAARESLHNSLDPEKRYRSLGEQFFRITAAHVVEPPLPAFRFFRGLQWSAYLLLFGLFILTLVGQETWRELIAAPGPDTILDLGLTLVRTIFSTRGLAALLSYLLLNLFLGLRFYRGYQRRLDRLARKRIKALKSELMTIWVQYLDDSLNELDQYRLKTREKQTSLTALAERKV